jgi:pimeloyl-ACP methyl ester carboxylesterase
MHKILRFGLLVGIIAMTIGMPSAAAADSPWPSICQPGSLPSHDPQYPADQLIIVCIPPNWNGQLVLYAHGYVPEQAPLALPVTELVLSDGTFLPNLVLSQGFAFATTSYHKNGYAVQQARSDLNNLLQYVKKSVPAGSLHKVYLTGASEGGEIAALMIEHYPDKYNGALAACGPIGGGAYQVRYLTDFRVVFDYFFPGVFGFGAEQVPPDAYLGWDAIYTPNVIAAITANPTLTAQLYSVTGAALDPANPSSSAVSSALAVLWYSIWGTNDLIATAGGMPYDNQLTQYMGSSDDAALNAGVERISSDGRARAYLDRFYQTTGNLQRPLVTLHTLYDPIVPFQHEIIYQQLVAAAGHSNFLTTIPVIRYGHCNFTGQEVAGALALLVTQVGP